MVISNAFPYKMQELRVDILRRTDEQDEHVWGDKLINRCRFRNILFLIGVTLIVL